MEFEDRLYRARRGQDLDKLINDRHARVRMEVAKQGYGLSELINDTDFQVRVEVAKQGYGLDKLVADSSPSVRKQVAEKGFGLDLLNKDRVREVREAVEIYLIDHELSLEDWIKQNPDKCMLNSVDFCIWNFLNRVDEDDTYQIDTTSKNLNAFISANTREGMVSIYRDAKMLFFIRKTSDNAEILYIFHTSLDEKMVIRTVIYSYDVFKACILEVVNYLRKCGSPCDELLDYV